MKVLFLASNISRASFRLRIHDHLDYLQEHGLQCDVSALPKGTLAKWRFFKSLRNYDVVFNHRKCLNFWDSLMFWHYCPKTIFDFDDAIMHNSSKPWRKYSRRFRLFRRTALKTDIMIAGNETLANIARKYCGNVHVLPTGLDLLEYSEAKPLRKDGRIRLVWIGSASTLPYLKKLRPVLEKIGRSYENVELRIIADEFFELENMTVDKRRWALETQASDLVECDIGLACMPDDIFTRGKCGFKILQYFAAGLPVIASPVGVNKEFVEQSNAGILAVTDEQWEAAIKKAIVDIDSFRLLGQNGKDFVEKFDRSVISQKLCQIIKSCSPWH